MELRYAKLGDGYRDVEFVEVLEAMCTAGLTPLFQTLQDGGAPAAVIGFSQSLPGGGDRLGIYRVSLEGCKRRDLAIVEPGDGQSALAGVGSNSARPGHLFAMTLSLAYLADESEVPSPRMAKIMAELGHPVYHGRLRDELMKAFSAIFTHPGIAELEVKSGLKPILADIIFSATLRRVRQPGRQISAEMWQKELRGQVSRATPLNEHEVGMLTELITGDGALAEYRLHLNSWKQGAEYMIRKGLPIAVDYAMFSLLCVAFADAIAGKKPNLEIKKPAAESQCVSGWLAEWSAAARDLGRRGQYARAESQLEIWAKLSDGRNHIHSGELGGWATFSRLLASQLPASGLVGVRAAKPDAAAWPGVTIVVETPMGGSAGAQHLIQELNRMRIGGVLACAEMNDRWGVVKLICSPTWYAQSGDEAFGRQWLPSSVDEAEDQSAKEHWCRHTVTAVRTLLATLPPAVVDAVYFDAYVMCDYLGMLDDAQRTALASATPATLVRALQHLKSMPNKQLAASYAAAKAIRDSNQR